MRKSSLLAMLWITSFCLTGTPTGWGDEPAKGSLVKPGAKVEKLAGGFRFTEGPAVASDGSVYFTDIPNERIHRWVPGKGSGKIELVLEDSGKANGLMFSSDGKLMACEGGRRQVVCIDPKTKKSTVLTKSFQDKKYNSPNDLWIDTKGGIYFTDPRYGKTDDEELKGYFVFYLGPGAKEAVLIDDQLKKPNGIIGMSDQKYLYVADLGDRKTYRYSIESPGKVTDKKLFCESGSDGMTLDEKGNLYLTTGKGVQVYNPDGKLIETIKVPEGPANVTFGGPKGDLLFITARTSVYAVPMNVHGQHVASKE